MSSPNRPHLVRNLTAALIGLGTLAAAIGVGSVARAEEAAPPPLVASKSDTGVLDINRDGSPEYATYGQTNAGLSAGEQGADGWELRYVAPIDIPIDHRWSVGLRAEASLSFRVWRADHLEGRKLVVTALQGGRTGTADFHREGVEVFRGEPTLGIMKVDVTEALKTLDPGTVTFRFALDKPPTPGDGKFTQINIATADGRESGRPTIHFTPVPPFPPEWDIASPPALSPAATTPAAPSSSPSPAATPPSGMKLAFADEFNGSSLDTGVWKPYHSTYGDGNNEMQCHTPKNTVVSGGSLKITARKGKVTCPDGSVREYSAGFLGTRETGTYFPRYGRFEMRARVPHGQGLWPAFWLRHRDGSQVAEVDIMEYFHSQVPGKTMATLHLDHRANVSKNTTFFEQPTASPGWHTFAADILPVSNGVQFTFYLDGKAFHTYTDTQRNWSKAHPGQNLWDIAVNMSVGGNWVGDPAGQLGYLSELDRCAQWSSVGKDCLTAGIRRAEFPSTYEVDYVRVFEKS